MTRKANALVPLPVALIIFACCLSCATPQVKKPDTHHADATIPEAVKANNEARGLLQRYRDTYGPQQDYGLIAEMNVDIPMRDGSTLKASVSR